jgi:lactoylglutathione lyase
MFTSFMPDLFTPDVDRARIFYRDLLGFRQTFAFPPEGPAEHAELRLGDSMLAISSCDAAQRVGGLIPSEGHPMELVVWCEDVDAAVARLRTAGTPVIAEPYDFVEHRRASVCDPDGNWVTLVSNG